MEAYRWLTDNEHSNNQKTGDGDSGNHKVEFELIHNNV